MTLADKYPWGRTKVPMDQQQGATMDEALLNEVRILNGKFLDLHMEFQQLKQNTADRFDSVLRSQRLLIDTTKNLIEGGRTTGVALVELGQRIDEAEDRLLAMENARKKEGTVLAFKPMVVPNPDKEPA